MWTLDEVLAHADDAMTISARAFEVGGDFPVCCGARVTIRGFLGAAGLARCEACGAEMRCLLCPLHSPILERGNAFVSVPSEALIARCQGREWVQIAATLRPESRECA